MTYFTEHDVLFSLDCIRVLFSAVGCRGCLVLRSKESSVPSRHMMHKLRLVVVRQNLNTIMKHITGISMIHFLCLFAKYAGDACM